VRPWGRIATVFAVGCLGLDGALLLLGWWWAGRLPLLIGGVLCLAGALLVLFLWRRYQRVRVEVAEARRALAGEARALQTLVGTPPAPPVSSD